MRTYTCVARSVTRKYAYPLGFLAKLNICL
jgi:hypothetical protein